MSTKISNAQRGVQSVLIREQFFDQQIIGTLIIYDGFGNILNIFRTLELPDRGNSIRNSCIPVGNYTVYKFISERYGKVFEVKDVFGRSGILIHAGNFHWQTVGCILLGQEIRDIDQDGLVDVSKSMAAMAELNDFTYDSFKMQIVETF